MKDSQKGDTHHGPLTLVKAATLSRSHSAKPAAKIESDVQNLHGKSDTGEDCVSYGNVRDRLLASPGEDYHGVWSEDPTASFAVTLTFRGW